MNEVQVLPIKSVISSTITRTTTSSTTSTPTTTTTTTKFFHLLCFTYCILFYSIGPSLSLELTNMNTPLVADIREEMDLDCHFDMGIEQLYAVKWYKDDQEFFRYMPQQRPNTMSFPVAGVHLVPKGTNCTQSHCKVKLGELTRDHSGGAYRCEISSEAPAFRLVSKTHNVTVAAIPRRNPRIEGLSTSYIEGDTVEVKCISDLADPAPILSWHINGHQAPSKLIGEMSNIEVDSSIGLVSRSLLLRFVAEKKYSQDNNSIELRCVSSLPGVPMEPQVTILTIPIRNSYTQKIINNQKLHWFNTLTSASNKNKIHYFLIINYFYLICLFFLNVFNF